jgi:hypothetical protein
MEVEATIKEAFKGTWLKRGGNFVYIEDLAVGNYVMAEAVAMPGDQLQRITVLSSDGCMGPCPPPPVLGGEPGCVRDLQ